MKQCRWCGYETDREVLPENSKEKPAPGDGNICLKCGVVGVYAEDMSIRPMNRRERLEFWSDFESWKLFQAWINLQREDGGVLD